MLAISNLTKIIDRPFIAAQRSHDFASQLCGTTKGQLNSVSPALPEDLLDAIKIAQALPRTNQVDLTMPISIDPGCEALLSAAGPTFCLPASFSVPQGILHCQKLCIRCKAVHLMASIWPNLFVLHAIILHSSGSECFQSKRIEGLHTLRIALRP